eukprot:2134434-Ditylum_brightwellii.AAC.1
MKETTLKQSLIYPEYLSQRQALHVKRLVQGALPEAERYKILQSIVRGEETEPWFYYLKSDLDGKPNG